VEEEIHATNDRENEAEIERGKKRESEGERGKEMEKFSLYQESIHKKC